MASGDGFRLVDLRSDTLTKPSATMRRAMAAAEVGDDVWGEDPTIIALETRCAKLFGKEASLFVPSGTMANLIAVMSHCNTRASEAIVGDKCHIILFEQGGISTLAGVNPRTVPTQPDGTLDLQDIRAVIRARNDAHYPWTQLICIENTHNMCGGRVVPLAYLEALQRLAKQHDLAVHMDGARVMNAAVALGVDPSAITCYVDSVSMCFSKGLGAPVGSILAGSSQFIFRARRARKALGGGMRQAGVLAAAALVALDETPAMLKQDHANARRLAREITKIGAGILEVDVVEGTQTNIGMVKVVREGLTAKHVVERFEKVDATNTMVRMLAVGEQMIRYVFHRDISAEDVESTISKLRAVVAQLRL